MNNKLFVYGTLQDMHSPKAILHGFRKQTDFRYPTIAPEAGESVEGQLTTVDDWGSKDHYEGCRPDDPDDSLYWRLEVDGAFVYVGNPEYVERHGQDSWDVSYTRSDVVDALDDATLEVID